MYLSIRDGKFWSGYSWGVTPRRYVSSASLVRSLQEAGEDIDDCLIVEDVFEHLNEHSRR
jgi:hypothetical protein